MRTRYSMLLAAAAIALGFPLGLPTISAQAETVVRYGISMADIPLTTGQPDRGAGAYQFSAYTIYDPLVAWEMDVSDRPGKLVPGWPPNGGSTSRTRQKWRFACAGCQIPRRQRITPTPYGNWTRCQDRPAVDKRQSAQVKPVCPRWRATPSRTIRHRDHDQATIPLPPSDAMVPGLQPRAI